MIRKSDSERKKTGNLRQFEQEGKELLRKRVTVLLLAVILAVPVFVRGAEVNETGQTSGTEGNETGQTSGTEGNETGKTSGTEGDETGKTSGTEGDEMGQVSDTDGKEMAWWQKVNAYEVYVNSFQDSDGDGYGDLNGIRQRLDHLEKLGVGAVWLTPVYESPMVDNGYDVADYYKINPRYGSMEDMDRLISEAGEKGIRIVMDLVFNHTSDQCEWFKESAKGKENDYSDFQR